LTNDCKSSTDRLTGIVIREEGTTEGGIYERINFGCGNSGITTAPSPENTLPDVKAEK
jgi:hypothetical protein